MEYKKIKEPTRVGQFDDNMYRGLNTEYLRGHKIEVKDGAWVFSDTKESVEKTWKQRPCGHCGLHNTPEGHDGCLGTLPGVMNACCGHGQEIDAYVQFPDGIRVDGKEAIKTINELKNAR